MTFEQIIIEHHLIELEAPPDDWQDNEPDDDLTTLKQWENGQ